MNGRLAYSNGFLLDDTENHSNIRGISVIVPNPDPLEEFKVTSSNYDAQFGNVSGALMQGATRSGANEFHGSAFEYLRNDVLNAADPFTSLNPPIRWNQFGGSLSGPNRKNKLFTFFAYQGTRRHLSGGIITTVPTADERTGKPQGQATTSFQVLPPDSEAALICCSNSRFEASASPTSRLCVADCGSTREGR
jgi:hypothetical protein